MAFDQFLVGRVYIIRWLDPTVADGIKLLHGVEEAHARVGERLIYIAIAPRDSPPPPEKLRKVMADHLSTMLKHCEVMHLVFEGVGFSQTVKRMALASIVMVSGMKGRMLVHSTVEHLLAVTSPDQRPEVEKALKAARISVAVISPNASTK